MEKNLYKIVSVILVLFSILIISNVVYTSLQKVKIEENVLTDLEEEIEENELENNKGKESKVKIKKILFPTDDDICHHFEFFNSFSYIKFSSYTDNQNDNTLQGFDKFVYSPPELV
ncbi:MAG: hypothetical protein J0L87_06440 [Bacteroidetes bacterium]|nr:hypothetical protein [Bacteroidota bacterium]